MITLLVGENSFEIERNLSQICDDFNGNPEKIDGNNLEFANLPDILMGVSLFADKRLVVIRNLSENKQIWPVFGDWLDKISDDINLILIESKPDKRTATYKSLKKNVIVKEFDNWSDRDIIKAENWVTEESKKLKINIDKKSIQTLVKRVGPDQWQLFSSLQKLALVDKITDEVIRDLIEPSSFENVFELFETATKGDSVELKRRLQILEKTEDVYKLLPLLYSQAFQLATIVSAESTDNVVKDFGIHPYVASKLESVAKKLGKKHVFKIISILAEADDDMKISKTDPWLIIELALLKIASI